jgi:hypothetical protein
VDGSESIDKLLGQPQSTVTAAFSELFTSGHTIR